MDTIEFRLSAFNYTADITPRALIHIFINGKNFWENLNFNIHEPLTVDELHENLSERYKSKAVEIYTRATVNVEVGEEIVTWKNFCGFVFDRAQYFREVEKLRRWRFNDKLIVEYGSIDCGFVDFNFMQGGKLYNFAFDELLSDPFPQLVNIFVQIQRGEPCTEELGDLYDDRIKVLKISVRPDADNIRLIVELIKKKILLTENYRREELAAMFKKIFDALLNDKYFPYSYPCYWYLSENYEIKFFEDVVDAIEDAHPDWTTGDVWNYAVTSGQLKLSPHHEKYLEHYKKMLSDYVIPDRWFDCGTDNF